MKSRHLLPILLAGLLLTACGGGGYLLQLGDAPLTIQVASTDAAFSGYANVYINRQFIGTTDAGTMSLKINLKRGEYTVVVTAEGYKPWNGKISLLGTDYKQNIMVNLEKVESRRAG